MGVRIDVQIVAGRCPELLQESLGRVLQAGEIVHHVFIANNTGQTVTLHHPKVTVVDNESPLSFEENHNRLARLGESDYILFLDDDAFIFPGAVQMLLDKLKGDQSILLAGGTNNQTWQSNGQHNIPKVASRDYFLENSDLLAEISASQFRTYGTRADARLFCPGNLMLTRRDAWQNQYGGWDERYHNWNEEVDYILWGYERNMKTVVMPGLWFFHGMSSSRRKSQLLENIVVSSLHLLRRFPQNRLTTIIENITLINEQLPQQLEGLLAFNRRCQSREFVVSSDYYTKIMPHLTEYSA